MRELLRLPLEPDETIFEQAMRPELTLYTGMLRVGDHQGYFEVTLSFPKAEGEETGFQILLRERIFGTFFTSLLSKKGRCGPGMRSSSIPKPV